MVSVMNLKAAPSDAAVAEGEAVGEEDEDADAVRDVEVEVEIEDADGGIARMSLSAKDLANQRGR